MRPKRDNKCNHDVCEKEMNGNVKGCVKKKNGSQWKKPMLMWLSQGVIGFRRDINCNVDTNWVSVKCNTTEGWRLCANTVQRISRRSMRWLNMSGFIVARRSSVTIVQKSTPTRRITIGT